MLKRTVLLCSLLISVSAFADLNEEYETSIGENIAGCVERKISYIDRIGVPNIRSYTKYDKHYVSLNTNSIYVDYDSKHNGLVIQYIKNMNVEKRTKAEQAKQVLINIGKTLFLPALKICKRKAKVTENIKFSMMYIDPPFKSRRAKEVIIMDEKGNFILP